ncbi:hypothetical protein BST20_08135 [Mycobacterium branderi]|uniref:Uncharacterized protein n=1 Tax=Mycobacterium branderi TaxID=43348 RepID=A0AA91RIT8_9MYCO|nr:hypothetical protein BST20_08135 [Mycobacterium branderi]
MNLVTSSAVRPGHHQPTRLQLPDAHTKCWQFEGARLAQIAALIKFAILAGALGYVSSLDRRALAERFGQ